MALKITSHTRAVQAAPTLIRWLDEHPQTFHEMPFCEVDALVLSCASYLLLESWEVVRGSRPVALEQAILPLSPEKLADLFWFDGIAVDFAKSLVCSGRYRNLEVSNVVSEANADAMTQFAAMCFHVPDGSLFLSFRGTDNTIAGWEEDLCLCVLDPAPSQELARKYLEDMVQHWVTDLPDYDFEKPVERVKMGRHGRHARIEELDAPFGSDAPARGRTFGRTLVRVGGHSKGGNLAFYAAMTAQPETQDIIAAAYSFDAPGFLPARLEKHECRRIWFRCHKYIPEASFFGCIFDDVVSPTVIRSSETGLMQHMPFSWQLEGDHIVRGKETELLSNAADAAITKWLDSVTPAEREHLLSVLFGVLDYVTSDGSVASLPQDLMAKGPDLLRQLPRMDRESFKVMLGVLQRLAMCVGDSLNPFK